MFFNLIDITHSIYQVEEFKAVVFHIEAATFITLYYGLVDLVEP